MKESRRTGDFSLNANAEVAVAKALELAPDDIPARKLEASLHLANHRFTKAVDAALAMKAELPRDSFVYGLLADAYVEIGDYTKAVEAAQTMVDLKPGTASYSRVAQIRSLHGDHQGAIEMFLQAARIADPADKETQSWCLVQLGDEYWKGGKFAEAEKIYDEALQNFPGYFFATVSKGRVRASVRRLRNCRKIVDGSAGPADRTRKPMLMLGDIYELRGEDDKARGNSMKNSRHSKRSSVTRRITIGSPFAGRPRQDR
jgi:tetratricopeptide (TPR) repeat protein